MEEITIVTLCNDHYAVHLATMLLSLFENKLPTTPYRIYIIDGNLSNENKSRFCRLLQDFNTVPVFLQVDQKLFKYCKGWGHVSREAFYRVVIPDLLDRKIKKAVYLDCDLIVKDDLLGLWNNEQLGHYFIGAVEDPVDVTGIRLPKKYKYFNSGVMLMNLEKWRKNKTSQRILQFIRRHSSKIMWWDQDALNAVLYNKWFELGYTWNFQVYRMKHIRIQPKIIHFNTDVKPWNGEPYLKEEYDYYRQLLSTRLNW